MSAVSPALAKTITELQLLKTLEKFALGGGTNLALRYKHRVSVDIDLFTNEIIGINGFKKIAEEATQFYGNNVTGIDYPCKINDQFVFLRFFIKQKDAFIKVEVLQNFQRLDDIEIIDGVKLLSAKDVGLLKLMSASNRPSKKDIFDLDFITDTIPLPNLYTHLEVKQKKFNKEEYQTIFDLDKETSPIERPELLIAFDEIRKVSGSRPSHSQDLIQIMEESKTWKESRYSWLRKVRALYRELGLEYPKPKGYDL
ncbi:nucleotidyl transferase AbiEii/AbiGii toxin family protein [Flagellimonas oceanensis]|uniref:nucleotidyl transferase AbiEii/AbiGii toxin family protein n=1 Tax=Flagellimonas oceanensis TaxID=2499163 RepID=UPI000F8D62FE|nr:nucleotidyl transferase AbiEii/AbiGii toxin family protein [Allomuricauda oceanensis]